MTCREARGLIHGMIDSELASGEKTDLDAHLGDCRTCRRYVGIFRALKVRILRMNEEAASPRGESRVRAFLDSGASSKACPPFTQVEPRPRFMYAAAAAVLVAFTTFAALAVLAPSQSLADTTIEQHRLRTAGKLVLDSTADCCEDLDEWFQSQVEHPVDVPEIAFEGIEVHGGKLYRHATGNEIFYVAYSLHGKPVSLFVSRGPNMDMPEGEPCGCSKPGAIMSTGTDHTVMIWPRGETIVVLVSPFDAETTRGLCQAIK